MASIDPRSQLRAGFVGRDEAVARFGAGVPHRVIQPLGVDDHLRARREWHSSLGRRIVLVLAQDHHRIGVVGEIEERTDDPAGAFDIETIVVVAVQVVDGVGVGIRLKLDDPAASDIGPGLERPLREPWGPLDILRDPDAVLVGLRRRVIPETVALDCAICTGNRGEPRVARGLPVDEDQVLPLAGVLRLVVGVDDDVARLIEDGQGDV